MNSSCRTRRYSEHALRTQALNLGSFGGLPALARAKEIDNVP